MQDEGGKTAFAESREIVQSRDLTLAEAKALTKAVTQRYVRGLKRDFWYRAAMIAHCGAMGVIVASALMLSYWFRCCSPRPFWWVIVGVLFYFGGAIVYRVRFVHGVAQANRSASPMGTRHVIESRGYTIERDGQHTFIPWHRIIEIDNHPGLLLASTSAVHFWPITAAAFAGQDAHGFCAELERRWNAARVLSA